MQPNETPKANPENLLAIINDAFQGKVVVPEFQRSFVWARQDIEELLASILQGYFVGTFLLLDTSADQPMFPFRPVEGLDQVNSQAAPHLHTTVRLVLDGQQRVTSLFYALYEPEIPLRWTQYPYKFYLHLNPALNGEIDEAVVGISTRDRRRMAEIQKLVREDQSLPFSLLRDTSAFYRWLYQEQKVWPEEQQPYLEVLYHRLKDFMIPVISLPPETGRANIVNIFERINRTGVTLSLFDLAVARMYLKDVRLRDLWSEFKKRNEGVAEVIKPEFLLKVIAVWEGKEPKRAKLLDVLDALDKDRFVRQWKKAEHFIVEAYRRITSPQGGYGAFKNDLIPYTTMIVPLAALLSAVEERKGGEAIYRKLDRWYWANVFTQRYDSAVDTKTYQDFKEVIGWLEGDAMPIWIANLSTDEVDFDAGKQRSAVYRGLLCTIILAGAKDFINGQAANLMECQDDHIFPKSKFKHPNVNVITNRTLISSKSNQIKTDKKPSEYLPLFLHSHDNDESRLLNTLRSHLISPQAYEAMKHDDFDGFIGARRDAMRKAVERLTLGERP